MIVVNKLKTAVVRAVTVQYSTHSVRAQWHWPAEPMTAANGLKRRMLRVYWSQILTPKAHKQWHLPFSSPSFHPPPLFLFFSAVPSHFPQFVSPLFSFPPLLLWECRFPLTSTVFHSPDSTLLVFTAFLFLSTQIFNLASSPPSLASLVFYTYSS